MKGRKQKYTQLNIEEREEIQEMLQDGYSLRAIGERLGRNHTSISRELKRNVSPTRQRYTPRVAHERTEVMRLRRGQRERLKSQVIRDYVEEKLKIGWSPEQIAGRLPADHPEQTVSHEAIYLYIYSRCQRAGRGVKVNGEDLRPYLRRKHRYRKRKYVPFTGKWGTIRERVSIDQRPKYIEKRRQIGHWEGDSIVSRQSDGGLNSLVERVTGLLKLGKIADGSAAETSRTIIAQLAPLPENLRRTLTTDNGKENAGHKIVSHDLKLRWFFCHPYASHERGTNENTNGLIREYFPKKTDLALIPDDRIQEVEDLLNNRPRKRLNYKTPHEVFFNSPGALTR